MNTRKLRKPTWKVQEAKQLAASGCYEEESDAVSSSKQIQNVPLVSLFLESWRESKEMQVNENSNLDVPEYVAQLMNEKGCPISINVARTKIANFIKKYNFAKKMALQGQAYVWKHFNAVKAILEYGPTIIRSENRDIHKKIIATEHIKHEDTTESTLKTTHNIEHTTNTVNNGGGGDVELIEIPDDDTANVNVKENFSEPELEIDTDRSHSDQSDEDLDFENPLDQIKLVLPNSKDNNVGPPPLKMPKLEKKVKSPTSFISGTEPDKKPLIIPNVGSFKEPPKTRPSQPHIIPLPSNINMPQFTENGTPMQYLIVRPINPNGQNQSSQASMAIPLAPNLKLGSNFTPGNQTLRFNAPMNQNGLNHKVSSNSNIPNLSKSLGQPPPLTQMTSNLANNFTAQIRTSPSLSKNPSNESSSSNSTDSVQALLGNVVRLGTNLYNVQQERLQIERQRLEMERDYGKEMIDIFREIKDKICDIRNHRYATTTTSSNDANNHDSVHENQ